MIKVIIVEDDPMVSLINKKYLEKIGDIKIEGIVTTEEEIINHLNTKRIDLILLDVFLPKKNGLEILKSIRNKKYLVDVIMVTAANNSDELKKAFAYGAVDYLVKPFEFDRFEEAIRKYKTRFDLFKQSKTICQQDIDKIYINNSNKELDLPKGLNKRTLNKIMEFLMENSEEIWTLREIAAKLNISNVTIKKYMDYLEEINNIEVESTVGNIGRPELLYKVSKEKM